MKKSLSILIIILILNLVGCTYANSNELSIEGDKGMYIALYDRQLNHITNVTNVKYEYTKRVFDFDTSSFSGISETNISNAFIFVLCNNVGQDIYSGFAKGINQSNKLVSFNGEDFRTIVDTEVFLDFTTKKWYNTGDSFQALLQYYPSYLAGVFQSIKENLESQVFIDYIDLPIDIITPSNNNMLYLSDWIGDFTRTYLIANANKFLKPYLAYYGYYISASFLQSNKRVIFEIKKNTTQKNISLKDFVYETKLTNVNTNKAVARIEFQTVYESTKGWNEIYNDWRFPDPILEFGRYDIMIEQTESSTPLVNIDNYPIGYRILVKRKMSDTVTLYINNEVINTKYVSLPTDLPVKNYYLGLDNQIYEGTIDISNKIFPVKSKIFEDAYLAKAQYAAVSELVNSRYNENILLNNFNSPIDLSSIELYTMIKVYEKQNNEIKIKEFPVSEIQNNNGQISINLGFKKAKFTEIIKDITKDPAIKSTSGSSGTGSGVTATNVETIIDSKVPDLISTSIADRQKILTSKTVSSATYTVTSADIDNIIYLTSSTDVTITLSHTGFSGLSQIYFVRYGTGEITFTSDAGNTIKSNENMKRINNINQVVSVMHGHAAVGEWLLMGALKL